MPSSTLACRATELAEATQTAGPDVAAATQRLADDAAAIASTCDAGKTRAALRALRRQRTQTALVQKRLALAIEDGRVVGPDTSSLAALVRLVDALRRATERLRRHPCPELLEMLAPRPGAGGAVDEFVPFLLPPRTSIRDHHGRRAIRPGPPGRIPSPCR
jgi:hypothetical protein